MFIRNWKRELFTIPNLLSLFRLVLLPVYAGIYLNATKDRQYWIAGILMIISCITDLLDGKIAWQYHQITNLGKILDPLADKVTQFVLTLCLSKKYSVLRPVLALIFVKEIFQLMLAIAFAMKGKVLAGALMAGKICTTVLFISLICLVLFPGINPAVINAIAVTDIAFLLFSFLSYVFAYFGMGVNIQDLEQ